MRRHGRASSQFTLRRVLVPGRCLKLTRRRGERDARDTCRDCCHSNFEYVSKGGGVVEVHLESHGGTYITRAWVRSLHRYGIGSTDLIFHKSILLFNDQRSWTVSFFPLACSVWHVYSTLLISIRRSCQRATVRSIFAHQPKTSINEDQGLYCGVPPPPAHPPPTQASAAAPALAAASPLRSRAPRLACVPTPRPRPQLRRSFSAAVTKPHSPSDPLNVISGIQDSGKKTVAAGMSSLGGPATPSIHFRRTLPGR